MQSLAICDKVQRPERHSWYAIQSRSEDEGPGGAGTSPKARDSTNSTSAEGMFQRSPQQPGEGGAANVSDESVDSAACDTPESESGSKSS